MYYATSQLKILQYAGLQPGPRLIVLGAVHGNETGSSFDTVAAGAPVAMRHDGTPVCAPGDGYMVFLDTHATRGNEWFYFAQPNDRDIVH